MTERLITDTPEFYYAVRMLRAMDERSRFLVLFAANFWSDAALEEAARRGLVPAWDDELPPARLQ